jgi:hypothetical protein
MIMLEFRKVYDRLVGRGLLIPDKRLREDNPVTRSLYCFESLDYGLDKSRMKAFLVGDSEDSVREFIRDRIYEFNQNPDNLMFGLYTDAMMEEVVASVRPAMDVDEIVSGIEDFEELPNKLKEILVDFDFPQYLH